MSWLGSETLVWLAKGALRTKDDGVLLPLKFSPQDCSLASKREDQDLVLIKRNGLQMAVRETWLVEMNVA